MRVDAFWIPGVVGIWILSLVLWQQPWFNAETMIAAAGTKNVE